MPGLATDGHRSGTRSLAGFARADKPHCAVGFHQLLGVGKRATRKCGFAEWCGHHQTGETGLAPTPNATLSSNVTVFR